MKRIYEWRKITFMAKPISKDTPRDSLAELKAKHFTPQGRKERIAKALEILSRPGATFKLDKETVKWVAQDVEIENI